ncbi:hypothetical protein C1J03_01625 [Sulfitobacter sp. SK012]|uniref:hypothetical protein n=1 Tax=Sulfitobacter sp. SK012 TaxID=1389005 RepID=UPI000E09E9F3|nr:hypothetical protein [Sulfitobacter sp. SK012]AXI44845.1 hypothetical protein C1J03_01625 [Sulfitobacter sp. SK012]
MSTLELTKTKMRNGVWEGIVPASAENRPRIAVTHLGKPVESVSLNHSAEQAHWLVQIPIPQEAIADGIQTLLIQDQARQEQIGSITLMAGEALGDDMRAEINLLRDELDMLKRAFRRHCLETM